MSFIKVQKEPITNRYRKWLVIFITWSVTATDRLKCQLCHKLCVFGLWPQEFCTCHLQSNQIHTISKQNLILTNLGNETLITSMACKVETIRKFFLRLCYCTLASLDCIINKSYNTQSNNFLLKMNKKYFKNEF